MFDKLPFPGPDMDKQIKEEEVSFDEAVECTDDLKNLIRACLIKNPEERPTIH
jgi:hypothetical protein